MEEDEIQLKTKASKNYYQILHIRHDAASEQIESAYCTLFEKYGPGAEYDSSEPETIVSLFKDITDAYAVLSDPIKRRNYDRILAQTQKPMGDIRALWTKISASTLNLETNPNPSQIHALSLEITAQVTLKEAIKGCKRTFDISDPQPCQDCSQMKPVSRLNCTACRGLGYFNLDRREEVELPPGMYEGMEVRKPDIGRYDLRAHKCGDLVIKIKIAEHPYLRVIGNDLMITVPVSLYEAILGTEIEIPSATGKVTMKIQPLTQPGRVYRLKGLGLAGADQLVTIEVVLPQTLTVEDLAHFRKLASLYKEPSPREKLFKK